ncbi:hypothetical protein [Candidatus Nanohalococcus occultus]|uniref:Uncharacterized protein n=1 Tax=Candidatus Nanohalococcus occultus TaxID=2978047 RepID=A0ABY8CD88_9ARCH|nr:hypothetical protein SVXNc_0136 [Candidatus Nanohaloarchaeota archaeon SVXNc]
MASYEDEEKLQNYVVDEFIDELGPNTASSIFEVASQRLEEQGSVTEDEIEEIVVNLERYTL